MSKVGHFDTFYYKSKNIAISQYVEEEEEGRKIVEKNSRPSSVNKDQIKQNPQSSLRFRGKSHLIEITQDLLSYRLCGYVHTALPKMYKDLSMNYNSAGAFWCNPQTFYFYLILLQVLSVALNFTSLNPYSLPHCNLTAEAAVAHIISIILVDRLIFKILCKELKLDPDFDFVLLAKNTPGYVGADLMSLIQEASMIAVDKAFVSLQDNPDITNENETTERDSIGPPYKLLLHWLKEQPPLNDDQLENLCITMKDFEAALKVVQPSSLREGFATIPNVTWDDVGALYDVREELKLSILDPTKYPKEFESLGLTKPAGILLCGPPGCGKTLLAKYVGESERAVRQCFQRAKNSAPCIIFFDELDALCRRRSDEGGSGVRVVDQLLTEMDGLESRKQVHVLGATNRPEIIDPAMLRPGRFDKILYVGLPNKMDREDILKTITSVVAITALPLSQGVSLKCLLGCSKCGGQGFLFWQGVLICLVPIYLLVVREASINAFKRFVKTERISNSCKNQEIVVSKSDFDVSFNKLRPSVSSKLYTPLKFQILMVQVKIVKIGQIVQTLLDENNFIAGTRMYKNYTEDAVKAAVAAHLAGTSLRDAESEFGVPMRTIKNKADKKHTMPVGKPTIFFRFGRTVSCKAIGEMW
ncbi:Nuclear valosin-containing protein-like [Nymphon striatum]|nr:Nuclear valosin-containing protein-like [Nymphon striatum]